MQLSEKERKLLFAIQFNATSSVPELQRITGLKAHTIHYYLMRFKEQGLIRRWAFINLYTLGFEEYEIFFSLSVSSGKKDLREKLLQYLKTSNKVVWVAELGGDYQYGMTIYARGIHEAAQFIESLVQKFGHIFQKKSIAVISSFSIFKKKYLSPTPTTHTLEALTLEKTDRVIELSEIDYKIIAALCDPGFDSHRAISKSTGIPRSTFEYRLKKLEDEKVILRQIYLMSATKLDMQIYKLLIYVRGIQPELRKRLYKFSAQHKNIVNFTHCLGNWDYEIGAEIEENKEIVNLTERLYQEFGELITDIEVLPVFQQTTSQNFMRLGIDASH